MITTQLYLDSSFAALRSANSIVSNANTNNQTGLAPVTKAEPCRHCSKPDWCYRLDNLDVCKRGQVAQGWHTTSKVDKDGDAYLAPITDRTEKKTRPTQTRFWEYNLIDGRSKVRVKRIDFGNGEKKKFYQEHWDGSYWKRGWGDIKYEDIDIYLSEEVRAAIAQEETIYIAEGEPKADVLWGKGLAATCNIGGSNKVFNTSRLEGAKQIVICPDRDKSGFKWAVTVYNNLLHHDNVKFLLAYPDSSIWNKVPESNGVDVFDWIEEIELDKEDIEKAVVDIEVFKQKLEANFSKPATAKADRTKAELKPSLNRAKAAVIEEAWGQRLRYNELEKAIELDGEKIDSDKVVYQIATELNIDITAEYAMAVLLSLAQKNASYHPVREYLEAVQADPSNHGLNLDELAARYLGTTDWLHGAYLKRHLIAAVARVFQPGCKHDNALILQGQQGIKKTTFFATLHGLKFFDDSLGDKGEKDELLTMHRYWCTEWGELENVFGRKDNSKVKNFLSRQKDAIRPPYGREVKEFKRMCVIVGSTNKDEIFSDETGDRRYWVIPIPENHTIDLSLVEAERDKIWAAAVEAYKNGEQWHLTAQEKQAQDKANEQFRVSDVWQTYVEAYVQDLTFVTTCEILSESKLAIEPGQQKKADEMRVGYILRRLGWKRDRQRCGRKLLRGWSRQIGTTTDEIDTEVVTEVVTGSSPLPASLPVGGKECDHLLITKLSEKKEGQNSFSTLVGETEKSSEVDSWSRPILEAETQSQQGIGGVTTLVTTSDKINQEPEASCAPITDELKVSQNVPDSVTVKVETEALIEVDEEEESAEVMRLTVMILQEIAEGWAVETLNRYRDSLSRKDLNKAAKQLAPKHYRRIVKMVKEAKQFTGSNAATGMVDGKLSCIEPGEYVFVTDEVHSSQIDSECKERLVYVKPVGCAWGNGIQVLESQLLEYKASVTS